MVTAMDADPPEVTGPALAQANAQIERLTRELRELPEDAPERASIQRELDAARARHAVVMEARAAYSELAGGL